MTETLDTPVVGKRHSIEGPTTGEQSAKHEYHWWESGLPVHAAVNSAHAPGCTGLRGVEMMAQVGWALQLTVMG
jgi:hypothetical protein